MCVYNQYIIILSIILSMYIYLKHVCVSTIQTKRSQRFKPMELMTYITVHPETNYKL